MAAPCHGVDGIVQALDAGADSIEHCSFQTASGKIQPVPSVLDRLAAADVAVSATLGRQPGMPLPPRIAANIDLIIETPGRLHAMGATVVAGTDGGISPPKPHDVLRYALADFIGGGVSALDGLRAMTSVAAKVCGVADQGQARRRLRCRRDRGRR